MINWLNKNISKLKKYISKYHVRTYKFSTINKKDKILFIYRCDLIGDYIISKDFLRLVRNCQKFKNYKIIFLGNIAIRDFILDFDKTYIDEYIPFNKDLAGNEQYKKALIKTINKYKYDYVINYMSIRNHWSEFIISNIKSGVKYGITGLEINLTHEDKIKYDKLYNVLYNVNNAYDLCGLELLNKITNTDNGKYVHSYNLNEKILNKFKQKYTTPYAIIFPSASSERKRMPFDKFMTLAEYLYKKYGFIVYICGSKEDTEIFKNFDIKNIPYLKDLCGELKISELPYLLNNSRILLTNDTCAMWIANCTKTPCVVFSNVHNFGKDHLEVIGQNYRYKSDNNYVLPDPVYEQILSKGFGERDVPLSYVNTENAIWNIDQILAAQKYEE